MRAGTRNGAEHIAARAKAYCEAIAEAAVPYALSVVYEWLLKRGFMLETKLAAKSVCGKTFYVNESGEIMICLAQDLTIEWAQGLADLHKSYEDAELWHVIVSWAAFGNDEKTRDANLRNVEQCLTANGLNSDCLTIV